MVHARPLRPREEGYNRGYRMDALPKEHKSVEYKMLQYNSIMLFQQTRLKHSGSFRKIRHWSFGVFQIRGSVRVR